MRFSSALLKVLFLAVCALPFDLNAQVTAPLTDRERELLNRIDKLESRIAALESRGTNEAASPAPSAAAAPAPPAASKETAQGAPPTSNAVLPESNAPQSSTSPLAFSDGTTLNFNVDGYYGYNFNHPIGRANFLRSNDVLSDNLSLNQIGFIVERAPDLTADRRLGYRFDLMFGQNTETLQGGGQNEPRPQVYRNIFQAYGSYILPVGSGLQLDFGKFASSLGIEGNYTKDQLNYSRSFFFNALPFYHMGLRSTYNVNPKLSLQYWLVNGANQTEDFNGFKSQAVLVTYKPTSKVSWNVNYYEGQEQRDVSPASNSAIPTLPTQPGLSIDAVPDPHNGRTHIIDSYASYAFSSKWSGALEGDYVINRQASNSAPFRYYGGAGYLHRQLTKTIALNGRFEYLKDRGLFTGFTQDLKEVTATALFQPVEGFQTRIEYRRDFTNRNFFLTNNPALLVGSQNTATVGLNWWFGGKTGSW